MSWVALVSLGFCAGALLGALQLGLLHLAVRRAVARRSQALLLATAPLRLLLPALGFLLATLLGGGACLAGALVGHLAAVQLARRRALPAAEGAP